MHACVRVRVHASMCAFVYACVLLKIAFSQSSLCHLVEKVSGLFRPAMPITKWHEGGSVGVLHEGANV